ncbi:rhodanese-like domain-containing protein [Thermocrinis sp.]|uniref:rhodanese-like domain-containing protein n=1 Tax=Thermocrinis sp. TaxID=2024383 RepID=UPI0026394EB9|nr:rhodanese-like domain-containing protein [Thermocrinis sp.]
MKRGLLVASALLGFAAVGFSYDAELAKKMDAMFSQMTPEVLKQKPCQIDANQLFEMIKKKEDFVILDVRTPQEQSITGITWKNTLNIPMHEVFKPENLNRLPKDKKIVVVCHSGDRAAAVVTGLRAIGFNNAYQFKGGIKELADKVGRNVVDIVK